MSRKVDTLRQSRNQDSLAGLIIREKSRSIWSFLIIHVQPIGVEVQQSVTPAPTDSYTI